MRAELVLMGQRINMAQRQYRRVLVISIYALFAALIFVSLCGYANMLLILAFICVPRFLGGRSHLNGLVPPFMSGDERETNRRDHAYFQAYWWWDLTLLPALAAVGLKNNPFYAGWSPAVRYFVDHLPYGFLVAAAILYYTLPQAILLWTEPDIEEAQ